MIGNLFRLKTQALCCARERPRVGRVEDRLRYFRRADRATLEQLGNRLTHHSLIALSDRESLFPSRHESIIVAAPYVGHLVYGRVTGDQAGDDLVFAYSYRGCGVAED